ncbi:MAG: hypothetical protein LBT79_02920 [Elusimicrobiota bacterium]|jgi:acetyl-CoA carboxylase biotin carboxyl carrier protein|nr:hypothetical protein [Elusimicrobiota bacterium]
MDNANDIDIKNKVKSLYDVMIDENLQELEVNSQEYAVSIKRAKAKSAIPIVKNALKAEESANGKQNMNESIEPQEHSEAQIASENTIKSPITGIFYKSASPTSAPFAAEGDIIEAGKALCIIEAMKVMNEIKAPSKVKIIKILVENAKSVEAGQSLFEIEKV